MHYTLFPRIGYSALLTALVFLAVGVTSLHAQSEEVKSARADVDGAAEELMKLKREEANEPTKEKALELKREALRKVLALTLAETESVYERLRLLDEFESEFVVLQQTLEESLGKYLAYLRGAEVRLKKAETLEAVQQFAHEFQVWRAAEYNQELKKAIEMNLVGQNRSALRIADARFSKVSAYVKRARAWHTKGAELETLLSDAAAHMRTARALYEEARMLLLAYVPVEEEDANERALPFEKDEVEAPPASISELVAASLKVVREAYGIFLKIAKLSGVS